MNLNKKFLKNELIWLASIGCEIIETDSYIIVKNKLIKTEDFNLLLLKRIIPEIKIIKIMKNHHLQFLKVAEKIVSYTNFIKERTEDINYVANYNREALDFLMKKSDNLYLSSEKKWAVIFPQERLFSKTIIPYNICLGNDIVGKVCLVFLGETIGIYDFEIYPPFRNMGYAKQFFLLLLDRNKNSEKQKVFIQTWRENISANTLYLSQAFKVFDNYYYFKLKKFLSY
ncbi:hypothetical protein EFM07_08430 [Lactococcus lactis]|uniref:GNAT family N-acetyltransferase n=1 Tax=Lactococcus lactis TaxID=1358 RepID=UPI00223ACF35|nr:GNAT family N-acetyltransferase [Lactococcus lactis]MCT1227468.1 hypothetical protein [Lactococcus lactis]